MNYHLLIKVTKTQQRYITMCLKLLCSKITADDVSRVFSSNLLNRLLVLMNAIEKSNRSNIPLNDQGTLAYDEKYLVNIS